MPISRIDFENSTTSCIGRLLPSPKEVLLLELFKKNPDMAFSMKEVDEWCRSQDILSSAIQKSHPMILKLEAKGFLESKLIKVKGTDIVLKFVALKL